MKTISMYCLTSALAIGAFLIHSAFPPSLQAQSNEVLEVEQPSQVNADRGAEAKASIGVRLRPSYHVNSHTPSEDYLIPLSLQWSAEPLKVAEIKFPEPEMGTYSFSDTPLSVFTGDFDIVTSFDIPEDAPRGQRTLTGKLRYQACTHKLCLPPKTVEVRLPVNIR